MRKALLAGITTPIVGRSGLESYSVNFEPGRGGAMESIGAPYTMTAYLFQLEKSKSLDAHLSHVDRHVRGFGERTDKIATVSNPPELSKFRDFHYLVVVLHNMQKQPE